MSLMNESVTLTQRDQTRLLVLNRILQGDLTVSEAADLLSLSVRHVRRVLAAYREDGPAAIVHGNRGRTPAHTIPNDLRQQVLALALTRYAGCNDQHLSELLAEHEGIVLSRSSLRRLLRAAGVESIRTRRPPKHRQRRLRKEHTGLLVQMDGSPHAWCGPTVPSCSLLAAIDDASGHIVAAVFRTQEDSRGYLLLLQQLVLTHGIPVAVYHDRHSIFRKVNAKETLDEQLAGRRTPTQVVRALDDLGITSIPANSPQAKGRIERLFGTLQDRLVTELRLADITTLDAANAFLPAFLARHNARFAIDPAQPLSAFRPLDPDLDLDQVFAIHSTRTVAADNTIQFHRQRFQIQPDRFRSSYTRTKVTVQERLDGSLAVVYQGRHLTITTAPTNVPVAGDTPHQSAQMVTTPTDPQTPTLDSQQRPRPRPAPDHPWRTPLRKQPVS